MTAEILREAAALMRKRAEAATDGGWKTYADPHDDTIVFDQYGTGVQSDTTYDVVCYPGQVYSRDAEHIASWHPAVALAVADWLEAEATSMDALAAFTSAAAAIEHEVDIRGASLIIAKGDRGEISLRADTSRPAVSVALAYLGRDQ